MLKRILSYFEDYFETYNIEDVVYIYCFYWELFIRENTRLYFQRKIQCKLQISHNNYFRETVGGLASGGRLAHRVGQLHVRPLQLGGEQGWKLMSCSHCQELCQQASWLLIGCTQE